MMHGAFFERGSDLVRVENEVFDGRKFDFVQTTYTANDAGSISYITWEEGVAGTNSLEEIFGDTRRQLCTVYYTGQHEGDYQSVVDGDWDAQSRNFAEEMVAHGMGDAYVRLNPEFNQKWSPAYPGSDGGMYAEAWNRTVDIMTSVSGCDFTFLFCPNKNHLGAAPESWPPDAANWDSSWTPPVVSPSHYDDAAYYLDTQYDLAPPDAYEKFESLSESEQDRLRREAWANEEEQELYEWVQFANDRGADVACVEWGISRPERGQNQPSGGDNVYYTRKMFEMFRKYDFIMQGTWQTDGDYGTMLPTSESQFPNSSAEWESQVKADTGSESHEYGGYRQPTEGTTDWHLPLNENFAKIEDDVKHLANRLDKLE